MGANEDNFIFPYKWVEKPKLNALLKALIKKDFTSAEKLFAQGMKLESIDESTFERVLFEFLKDYEIMNFLIKNGFNKFHFPYIECIDVNNRIWGLVGRAYNYNDIKNKKVIELLFSAGFNLFEHGQYWASDGKYYQLWKFVLLSRFDNEFIDLMLSYGYTSENILYYVDKPEYNQRACNYVKSNPPIDWKGYSLNPGWDEEIPEPQKPHIGLFMSTEKKEFLEKQYEREMYDYKNKKRVQKEFIESVTPEEWKLKEEQEQIQRAATDFWIQGKWKNLNSN